MVGILAVGCFLIGAAVAAPAPRPAARKPAPKKPGATPAPARPAGTPQTAAPAHPQFLRDVAPILDREGCSAAACHGKFGGRGDFQVSLLTLAPEDDYVPMVLGARGRRVNFQEPEQSLLLTKPTGDLPHGGGVRFKKGSLPYRILLNWIRDGAPRAPSDARLARVTVTPSRVVSRVGRKTQLKVTAAWSDGRVEDVTRKAIYASADEPVATVTPSGAVTGVRWGGTAIQVRFLGQARAAFFTLPQVRPASTPYPAVPRTNVVDRFVFDNLKRMNVVPSALSTDAQFCRRVYLDVIGLLPTPEELGSFLAECEAERKGSGFRVQGSAGSAGDQHLVQKRERGAAPVSRTRVPDTGAPLPHGRGSVPGAQPSTARARLIDALLARPEAADLRLLRLSDLLRLNPRKVGNNDSSGSRAIVLFHEWLKENVARNRPYDALVRDLLLARGSLYFNGPAAFWGIERQPNDRAETVGQAFLGTRLQCARCHKHPFDRWTTDDYWDFSAFFGRVQLRRVVDGLGAEQEVYYNPSATVLNQSVNGPRRGLPARPTFLGERPLEDAQLQDDVSVRLADWVTSRRNPFFARAAMNRLWSNYFGRALIHPVDDMRETAPESVPGLLDALASEFIDSGFDLRHMTRLLLNSRAYQLQSEPNASNALDDRFYSHFYPRPMLAQVLLDVLNQATGTTEQLSNFPYTRAVELPLPSNSQFLTVFGQSHREYLAELDPKLEPNLVQTLYLINSPYLNGKIRSGAYLRESGGSPHPDEELVRQAFLRTLCRLPSADEKQAALRALSRAKSRAAGVETLLWALVSAREFLFVS